MSLFMGEPSSCESVRTLPYGRLALDGDGSADASVSASQAAHSAGTISKFVFNFRSSRRPFFICRATLLQLTSGGRVCSPVVFYAILDVGAPPAADARHARQLTQRWRALIGRVLRSQVRELQLLSAEGQLEKLKLEKAEFEEQVGRHRGASMAPSHGHPLCGPQP